MKWINLKNIDEQELFLLDQMIANNLLQSNLPLIGQGNNGQVFCKESYALKIFSKTKQNDPLILKELQEHPCFPNLFAYLPRKAMLSEFIPGRTLKMISNDVIFPYWLDYLEEALQFCQKKGFAPYDIHASNVVFDRCGLPRIVDVGGFKKSDEGEIQIVISKTITYLSTIRNSIKTNYF